MIIVLVLSLIGIVRGAAISTPTFITNAPGGNSSSNTSTLRSGSNDSLPRPLQDPFPWHIHGSPLTLLFSSFGNEIDEDDIISCDIAAKKYVHDVVQAHGDGPIPPALQLFWAHKSAMMAIQHSPRMTYSNLMDVFTGIQTFQLAYDYFEVHFEILDKARGLVGSGNIGSSTQAEDSATPTLPIEGVSPALIPPQVGEDLPDPPFVWPRNYARIKLTFTAYGPEIAEQDILTCYAAAANYILQIMRVHGNIIIAPNVFLHWTHGTASLTVQHMPRMRFGDLADVITALDSFQSEYRYTEAAFRFSGRGHGILGAGSVESSGKVKNTTSSPWVLSIPANTTALPTLPTEATSWTLPPDPTTVRLPNSPLFLTFTDYGRSLPSEDSLHALLLLTQRVITELMRGKKDEPILEALYVKPRRVLMVVSPEAQMTWGKLAVALEGLSEFFGQWGWLTCTFLSEEDGVGIIGNGLVMYV